MIKECNLYINVDLYTFELNVNFRVFTFKNNQGSVLNSRK